MSVGQEHTDREKLVEQKDIRERTAGRSTIARSLFLLAIAVELATMVLTTWLRYRHQGLDPVFIDLTKTADLLGILLLLPFLVLFLIGFFLPRLHRVGYALTAVMASGIGLGLLIVSTDRPLASMRMFYILFLTLKALELSVILTLYGKRHRGLWRMGLNVVILTVCIITASYLAVIAATLVDPMTPSPAASRDHTRYDAGVILGAAVWSGDKPSPVLRERIRKGYELLENGTVEFIVLTGGSAPNELTEAEVAKRELLKLGADPTRIVLEEQTSSTVEQVLFIRDVLTRQGWTTFVIISDQFHLKRALEICAFNDIEADGIASESPLGPTNLLQYYVREGAALTLYWLFGI